MNFYFHCLLLFISLTSIISFSSSYKKNNINRDISFAKNLQSFLQLNISYNESKEAFNMLQNLKDSYQNYSKEIKNISETDYLLCISELNTYNCSFKNIWKDEILQKQEENDRLTEYLTNNLTIERNQVCNNFVILRKKIFEEKQNFNESVDIFFVHLIGVKKAMEFMKNFYNLTTLSSLFLRFQNNIKAHKTSLIAQTANEIKELYDDIKSKIDIDQTLEEKNIFDVFKTHAKKTQTKDKKKKKFVNLRENRKNFNFTGKDIKAIVNVYKKMNNLLDLMKNTTIFMSDYHNSILDFYDKELEDLKKSENLIQNKFNETYNKISNNTIIIKDYEAKINICIEKAVDEFDCDMIKTKAEELLEEVEEFLKILDEILQEFK